MNAQEKIADPFNCIKANTLIIKLKTKCPDPDTFMKFLHRKLTGTGVVLHLGKHYSFDYIMPIQFTLVGGIPNLVTAGKIGCKVKNMGYKVCKHTKIRLEQHFNIQPVELLIGYDSELKPLQSALAEYFANRSDYIMIKQLSEFLGEDLFSEFKDLNLEYCKDTVSTEKAASSVENKDSLSHGIGSGISETAENAIDDSRKSEYFIIKSPKGCGKSTLIRKLSEHYPSVVFNSSKDFNSLVQLANSKKPCLFLIDDLDQIKNLKSLPSALANLKGLMVIATASSIPLEFHQPRKQGRLSTFVTLGKPDEKMRRDILSYVNNRGNEEVDSSDIIEKIATATHGCSTRDVLQLLTATQLCDEEDVDKTIKYFRPSQEGGLTGVERSHNIVEEDIHVLGYSSVLEKMEQNFNFSLHHASVFESMRLTLPSKMLLFGPPGCGKTHLVKYFAQKYSLPLKSVNCADVFGKYYGESETNLTKIFDDAMNTVPSILHFPSFEGLGGVRNEGHHEVEGRVINLLKARLDGVIKPDGLIVIAETSKPGMLDSNLIRAGRFSSYIHVNLPSERDRLEALQHFLRDFKGEVDKESLCEKTKGCTMAEIESFCREISSGSSSGSINKKVMPQELAELKKFADNFSQQ